jgi:hypothetical protein
MAVLITNPAPAASGLVMGGRLEDASLNTSRYKIALYHYASGAWAVDKPDLPVSPVWTYGMMSPGTRYAAALVTIGYEVTGALPVLGDDVLAVATSDAGRVAFAQPPAAGTVSGTAVGVSPFTSYAVYLFTWAQATGWTQFGAMQTLTASGGWSFASVPAAAQYAVVLAPVLPAPPIPTDGTLPERGVVSTLFSSGLGVAVTTVPPAAGGALAGGLLGMGSTRGHFLDPSGPEGLQAIAYVQDANNNVTATARTPCTPGGSFSFASLPGAAQYTVAVATPDVVASPRTKQVPVQGGRYLAVRTVPVAVAQAST